MLKNYADEQRRYKLLKRIDGNLLKIVFSEIPLQKIKCFLEDKGYDEFCSIFAKRAMLTPEEKNYLFKMEGHHLKAFELLLLGLEGI